jgi:hypothetical protein
MLEQDDEERKNNFNFPPLSRIIEDNKIKPKIRKIFLKSCLGHGQKNEGQCRIVPGAGQRKMQDSAGKCRKVRDKAGKCRKVQFRAGRCRTVQESAVQSRKVQESAGQYRKN